MKSPLPRIVSCVIVLAWLAGRSSAPAATPVLSSLPAQVPNSSHGLLPKPGVGSQINWGNPLSTGLVSLVALNEGSGNAFYDSAAGRTYHAIAKSGTPKGASPPTWFTPNLAADYPWGGPALANNGAYAQAIVSNTPTSQLVPASTRGYTYAVLLQPLDTTTFGRIFDATGAAVTTLYLNMPGSQGTVSTTWRNAAGKAINLNFRSSATNGYWLCAPFGRVGSNVRQRGRGCP